MAGIERHQSADGRGNPFGPLQPLQPTEPGNQHMQHTPAGATSPATAHTSHPIAPRQKRPSIRWLQVRLRLDGCHLRPSLPSFSCRVVGPGLAVHGSCLRCQQPPGVFPGCKGTPTWIPSGLHLSLFILSFSSHEHCSIHHESINRHQPDFLALARGTSTLAHRRRLLSNSALLFFFAEKRISLTGLVVRCSGASVE
jgi:hypothetical protein